MRFCLFFLLLIALVSCENNRGPLYAEVETSKEGERVLRYHDVNMRTVDTKFPLKAHCGTLELKGKDANTRILADSITVSIDSAQGGRMLQLQAGRMLLLVKGMAVEFSGKVLLDAADEGQVEMEEMSWEGGSPTFQSSGAVRLFLPMVILEGEGLTADVLLSAFQLAKVTSALQIPTQ